MAYLIGPPFTVKEHRSPAQYIRNYAQGVTDQHKPTTLAIKQYIPASNPNPQDGDVTIIFAGGIGFIKELYEPLFEDLEASSVANGYRIRSIWVADPATFGESAYINAENMGNQPSWWDHSRDLLSMINNFREHMPQPLIGVGHSIGAAQMAYLSILHPALLSTLVLIEPAIYPRLASPDVEMLCRSTVRRREEWPTRAEAEAAIEKNPVYKTWDARALAALKKHALRAVPGSGGSVRTTSSKHQEIALVFMPNFGGVGLAAGGGADALTVDERRACPDIDLDDATIWYPVWRPECIAIMRLLPALRPSVLYVVGDSSGASRPDVRATRLRTTGTGIGGSGGERLGRVKQVVLERGNHMIAMDGHLGEVVRHAGAWVGDEIGAWREREAQFRKDWWAKSREERAQADPTLLAVFAEWAPKKALTDIVKGKL